MWVHATLVHVGLDVYTRYVGSLTIGERQRYYEEQMLLAEKFGVPRSEQPATYAEFYEYFDAMLGVGLDRRHAMRCATWSTPRCTRRSPASRGRSSKGLNLATVGMLPASLRSDIGLPWGPNRQRLFDASQLVLSARAAGAPAPLPRVPAARSADRRACAPPPRREDLGTPTSAAPRPAAAEAAADSGLCREPRHPDDSRS